jgi:hypothetical protein
MPDGAYVIVRRLPERDGGFEYQIKNLAEHARESVETKSMAQVGATGRVSTMKWPYFRHRAA